MQTRRFLSIALLVSAGSVMYGEVSPIDPTLPYRYGTMTYPMDRYETADEDDWCLHYDAFAGGYHRQANKAFSCEHGSGDDNETSVSRLIFGQEKFTLGQSFPGGKAGQNALRETKNPFIDSTTLVPKYDFAENGAMFRASVHTTWGCWRMGLRGSLPFRSIDVKEVCSGDQNGIDFEGIQKKEDLYTTRLESRQFQAGETTLGGSPTVTNTVFAARLDLLSAMDRIEFGTNGLANTQPLVNYQATGTDINGNTVSTVKIARESVGFPPLGLSDPSENNNEPPVAVIQRNDGSLPVNQRWGDLNTQINDTLNGDGSGLSNNQRGRFAQGTNYAALSNDGGAQSQLWVVPTLATRNNEGSNGAGSVTNGARQIQTAITNSLPLVDDSISDFIESAGLDFCDGRTQGAGDMDLELYLGYDWTDCADIWSEFSFGFRIPTGEEVTEQDRRDCAGQQKQTTSCKNVLRQPAGLNDHLGIRLGTAHGWDAFDWLKLNMAFRYTFVIEDDEFVAAPFQGATIKGIGPCICAETQWGFLEGYLNATMPVSECCGFDLGYVVYHQPSLDCDDICLKQDTATDLAGRQNQKLDPSVLTMDTERTSHKVRTAFHMANENCTLNIGFDHAFAGQNIIRDTNWYAGVSVDF